MMASQMMTIGGGNATIQATLTGTAPWSVTWSDGTTQNNILISPVTRSVSPYQTTTYTITTMTGASCSGTATGSAVVTVTPPAPQGVRAGMVPNGSQIVVSWTPMDADSFVIQRSF